MPDTLPAKDNVFAVLFTAGSKLLVGRLQSGANPKVVNIILDQDLTECPSKAKKAKKNRNLKRINNAKWLS